MSKIENCIERSKKGVTPMILECMECLNELNCPVYQNYKKEKAAKGKYTIPAFSEPGKDLVIL